MSPPPRFIDTLPDPTAEDVKEKKVIILSLSRSGTIGLCTALESFGYTPYNMYRVQAHGYEHARMFHEALQIKRGEHSGRDAKPYSRADFDKWTGGYDVLSIVSGYLAEEVIAAYPDAKFILTTREPEAWARSIWDTVLRMNALTHVFPLSLYKYFDRMELQYSRLVDSIVAVLTRGLGRTEAGRRAAMEVFKEHNERVAKLVPSNQLLVVKLEDGLGWDQLCPFLGVDVPSTPYPRINDTKQFQAKGKLVFQKGRRRFIRIALATTTLTTVVAAAGLWYKRR